MCQAGETCLVQKLPVPLARRTGSPLEERYFTMTHQASRDEHGAMDGALLEVQDNGLGLDPAQQKKLFGLFQRRHVHVEGADFGLYMMKKMMENAGDRIEVDNQSGIGFTLRLNFPLSR